MIIGTAGHIDHGKTALVKALTGIDADRLREEKARGITIDLGFAYKPLPGGEILGFVDVPGHEKFIHNMLAGATGIDYVLMVIAADDGPMPQTFEHLAIVDLLRLTHGAVVLTKIDTVAADRVIDVDAQIRVLLAGTTLAAAPVFPVSAITGAGVDALDRHLRHAATELANTRETSGQFRLAVDRCFTLAGIGVVVTGTVFSGQVAVGDKLVVSPSGIAVRVRGIHAQNQLAVSGHRGQRCALNLAGPQLEKSDIRRGDWVVAEAAHAPTSRLDVRLKILASEDKPLKHWTPVHVHIGAADISARVAILEANAIAPGSDGLAQLILQQPTGAFHGDRVVLRDQSAQRTLGGGSVIDAFPPERGRRKPQRLAVLRALDRVSAGGALRELLVLSPLGVDLKRLALLWNLSEAEFEAACQAVAMVRVAIGLRTLAFAHARWAALREHVQAALGACLKNTRDSRGMTAESLRSALSERLPRPVFDALIAELLAEKRLLRDGPLLLLPGHTVSLSAADTKLAERLFAVLAAAKLQPPKVSQLAGQLNADDKQLRALLRRLAQSGELHAVSADYYFLPETVAGIAAITARTAQQEPSRIFTVARFRVETGVSRNLTIPLLEFFDRVGFTLRVGEGRKVRREWAAVVAGMR